MANNIFNDIYTELEKYSIMIICSSFNCTNHDYFTGEGKIPSNLMRQKHWDALAYPRHYPTGKWSLHHERKQKLSRLKKQNLPN